MPKTALILLCLTPLVSGQFDDRMWLVQAGAAGPGQVFECSRDGTIVGTYPGPALGSGGVVKDLFLSRIWVCDDGHWNGLGQPTGAIRSYTSGLGATGIWSQPGARGIVQLSNGHLAVLINPHPLQPSELQIIPAIGLPTPPTIQLGTNAVEMVAGREETVWTLNRVSGDLSRVQYGIAQTINPVTSAAVLDRLVLLADSGVLVTFQGQPMAARFDESGLMETPIVLPEPVLRVAADSDTSAYMLAASGTLYRFDAKSGAITDQFPVPGASFGALIPGQRGRVWIEETTSKTVTCYGYAGQILTTISLPYASHSRGDPLGLQWAGKTQPESDVDGDNVASIDEIHHGSDLLVGTDVPPTLLEVGQFNGLIPFGITAPGRGGRTFVLLASLSGVRSVPLGADGVSAPYFDLAVHGDGLAYLMLVDQTVQGALINMPFGQLDAQGVGVAAIDLQGLTNLPPGLVQLHACAMVLDAYGRVDVTTNPVCFDNLGTPCP